MKHVTLFNSFNYHQTSLSLSIHTKIVKEKERRILGLVAYNAQINNREDNILLINHAEMKMRWYHPRRL